jgi:hypothetical protein
MTSKPVQEVEPLQELDGLLGAIASGLGAEPPPNISAETSGETAAINNMLRLVGTAKLTHTLTRDGWVVVPARDGDTELALRSYLLGGEEWITVFMILLIDLPDTPEVAARVEEFLREGNRYLGAKFHHIGPELQVHADLPCEGLNTPLLLAVMRRLLAVVEDAAYDIDQIGAGRLPGGVFPALDMPIEHPLQLDG